MNQLTKKPKGVEGYHRLAITSLDCVKKSNCKSSISAIAANPARPNKKRDQSQLPLMKRPSPYPINYNISGIGLYLLGAVDSEGGSYNIPDVFFHVIKGIGLLVGALVSALAIQCLIAGYILI